MPYVIWVRSLVPKEKNSASCAISPAVRRAENDQGSFGGWRPRGISTSRRLMTPSRFKANATIVARPVSVRPTILKSSSSIRSDRSSFDFVDEKAAPTHRLLGQSREFCWFWLRYNQGRTTPDFRLHRRPAATGVEYDRRQKSWASDFAATDNTRNARAPIR